MSCAILQLVIGHKGNYENSCQECTTGQKTMQMSVQVVGLMINHKDNFVRLSTKTLVRIFVDKWMTIKWIKMLRSGLLIEWLRKTTHPNEAVASFTEHTHLVGNLGEEHFNWIWFYYDEKAYLGRCLRNYDAGKQGLEMKMKDSLLNAWKRPNVEYSGESMWRGRGRWRKMFQSNSFSE